MKETKIIIVVGGANKFSRSRRIIKLAEKNGLNIVGQKSSKDITHLDVYPAERELYCGVNSDLFSVINPDEGNFPVTQILFEEDVTEEVFKNLEGVRKPVIVKEYTVKELSEIVSKAEGSEIEVKVKQ